MSSKDWIYSRKDLHFKKGDVVFNEQDEGEEMYLIDSGEIQIVKAISDIDVNIKSLSSGDFFGEMTLITGRRRVASAIALTDCNLHVIDKEAYMSNIANSRSFVNRAMVTLARRVEEIDLGLAFLYNLVSKGSKP